MTQTNDTTRVFIPLTQRRRNGRPRILPPEPEAHFQSRSQGAALGAQASGADGLVLIDQQGRFGATDRPLVSTDLRARPESIIMALPETRVTKGGMLRVFGWYDNEWGFSNRMLDVALRMGAR